MELFYFITGVLVSIVGVMVYNYSKLDSRVKILLNQNDVLAKRNADHNITIDAINNVLTSDDYRTSKELVNKFKEVEGNLKKIEQSLNTLAKKSNMMWIL